MKFFIFVSNYCSLNLNLDLNLCNPVVLQSIIILNPNSLSIKIMLCCFLVHLLILNYAFYCLEDIFLQSSADFYDVILLLYVFNSTTIFHHCLLLFIDHFFHTFFYLYQPYLHSIFHSLSRISNFFLQLVIH